MVTRLVLLLAATCALMFVVGHEAQATTQVSTNPDGDVVSVATIDDTAVVVPVRQIAAPASPVQHAAPAVTGDPATGIGDRVFLDHNGDGIQDGTEPGLADVTVNLLDADGNGFVPLDPDDDAALVAPSTPDPGDDTVAPAETALSAETPLPAETETATADQTETATTALPTETETATSDQTARSVEPATANGSRATGPLTAAPATATTTDAQAVVAPAQVPTPQLTLVNQGDDTVIAGGAVVYGHVLSNPAEFDVIVKPTVTSDQGFPVELWIDVDSDGVNDPAVDTLVDGNLGIPAGGTLELMVRVVVPEGTPAGTVDRTTLTVTPLDNPAAGITIVDVTTVAAAPQPITPELTIVQTATPTLDLVVGDVITWTLVFTNTGTVDAPNVVLSAPVPAATAYVPGSTLVDGVPFADDADAMTLLASGLDLGLLVPGQVVTISFATVVTEVPASGMIENRATGTWGADVLHTSVSDPLAVTLAPAAPPAPTLVATGPADEPVALALGALVLLALGSGLVVSPARRRDGLAA